MKKCLIYDNSLRFARTIYGFLSLAAFLFRNIWLVLITAILMAAGIISHKYNIFYQFHYCFLRPLLKDKSVSVERELNELRFACGLGMIFLLSAFFLNYLGKAEIGWVLVLIVSLLMLLAGLAGFCTASFMYAVFKKIFIKKR